MLNYLKDNDWIIRSSEIHRKRVLVYHNGNREVTSIAEKLSLNVVNKAYYRDVYVWLPDVRWGKELMPSCPACKTNKDVGVHGFCDDYFGKLVVRLEEN